MAESGAERGVLPKSWAGRIEGAVAGAALAVANVGAVLANVDSIRQFLWARLGLFGLENLYLISAVLVAGALAVYGAIAALIHFLFLRRRSRRIAIAYWVLVGLTAPIIAVITFNEFGPSRTPKMMETQIERLKDTTLGQYSDLGEGRGAFRFALLNPSDTPQGWTSAQALAALLSSPTPLTEQEARIARHTLDYLAQVRTRDGWGYLDGNAVGITEIAGWVIVAEALSLDPRNEEAIWGDDQEAAIRRVHMHLGALVALQQEEGGWTPTRWRDARNVRNYSTVMALMALLEAARQPAIAQDERWRYDGAIARGVRWLTLRSQTSTHGALGWFPNPTLPRQTGECLGLMAQSLYVLQLAQGRVGVASDPDFASARRAFLEQALDGARRVPGASSVASRDFHFICQAHDSDVYQHGTDFRLESSRFLWYPWTLAAVAVMEDDPSLEGAERNMARTLHLLLAQRSEEAGDSAHNDQALYVVAETLYAANASVLSRD